MNVKTNTCECGCGEKINAGKRFVSTHNLRGMKPSLACHVAASIANSGEGNPTKRADVRAKISKANTGKKQSLQQRLKRSRSMTNNPLVIAGHLGNTNRKGSLTSKRALKNIALGFLKRKNAGSIWGIKGWVSLDRLGIRLFYWSTWERNALIQMNADKRVQDIVSGRPLISYVFGGRQHTYIPDFKVQVGDACLIVEVKPKHMLKDLKTFTKIQAGNEYAVAHKMLFQVWTEDVIFSSNGVTTMLTEAIQSATATHQNGGRYSLTSPVTARGEEKSLIRQAGEQE